MTFEDFFIQSVDLQSVAVELQPFSVGSAVFCV